MADPDNDYEYDCQGEGHFSGRVFAVYDEKTLTPKQHAMAVKLYGSAPDQCRPARKAFLDARRGLGELASSTCLSAASRRTLLKVGL